MPTCPRVLPSEQDEGRAGGRVPVLGGSHPRPLREPTSSHRGGCDQQQDTPPLTTPGTSPRRLPGPQPSPVHPQMGDDGSQQCRAGRNMGHRERNQHPTHHERDQDQRIDHGADRPAAVARHAWAPSGAGGVSADHAASL